MRVERALFVVSLATLMFIGGCVRGPVWVRKEDRKSIDRSVLEFPTGYEIKVAVRGLTAPTAVAVVNDESPMRGTVIIAESGIAGGRPRIFAFKPDGTFFDIYPRSRSFLDFSKSGPDIQEPIGGMVVSGGKIFVSHRDSRRSGAVTELSFDGKWRTVVADLPAVGDHSVTDIAVRPTDGRLFFGIGSATNSGVVGLDNWQVGWVERNRNFCDVPHKDVKLLGNRFDTKNPRSGLFGGDDLAVTGPFQPFGKSNQTRIPSSRTDKPTAAIYSISPAGGDLRVEAHGVRLPRGLSFDEFGNLYFTNNGMELRGTRPVKDDPDALLRFSAGFWYGWPDYSTDLQPISLPRFQPPTDMIIKSGYPELTFLIDHSSSALTVPTPFRDSNPTLVRGIFPALSGAAKIDFVPSSGAFREFRGSAIVTLSGDRAPFATSGKKLIAPQGRRVVRVDYDLDKRTVDEFVRNTRGVPASVSNVADALERPVDVKFAPDDILYILDMGQMVVDGGKERVWNGTGKLYIMTPVNQRPTTPK